MSFKLEIKMYTKCEKNMFVCVCVNVADIIVLNVCCFYLYYRRGRDLTSVFFFMYTERPA